MPLSAAHDLQTFDCGDMRRNAWLREGGLINKARDYSQTYVGITAAHKVVAFYALSSASFSRQSLPRGMRHGAPDPVPMILLGQLATDRSVQGKGVGEDLMLDAFIRVVQGADLVGCHIFGVNPAEPWLIRYYEKFGFWPVATAMPNLMLMTVPTIRQNLLRLGA